MPSRLIKLTPEAPANVTAPVPTRTNSISVFKGKATAEFKGSVTVMSALLSIHCIVPASVSAKVYEAPFPTRVEDVCAGVTLPFESSVAMPLATPLALLMALTPPCAVAAAAAALSAAVLAVAALLTAVFAVLCAAAAALCTVVNPALASVILLLKLSRLTPSSAANCVIKSANPFTSL